MPPTWIFISFQLAVSHRQLEITKLLLSSGPEIDIRDDGAAKLEEYVFQPLMIYHIVALGYIDLPDSTDSGRPTSARKRRA